MNHVLCVFELHSNNLFCSPEITPTVDQINHSFGPTHPGGRHTVCMYMLGCAVLLCLVCLTLLASFFLPSHLSLKHVHTCIVALGVTIHCTHCMQLLLSEHYNKQTSHLPMVLPISCWSSPSPAGPPHLSLVPCRDGQESELLPPPLPRNPLCLPPLDCTGTNANIHACTHTHVLCAHYGTIAYDIYHKLEIDKAYM